MFKNVNFHEGFFAIANWQKSTQKLKRKKECKD